MPPQTGPFRERFLETLLESATDYAVIAADVAGLVTLWNEGARLTLGWAEPEIVGRPLATIFTDEDRAARIPENEMRAAVAHGRGTDERWHLRSDGTTFWASGEMMPLRDVAGAHIGFLKILRDRTEQRLAAERQQADAEFLRSVLASSADCIKVLDLDARLVFMSEGGKQVMEVSDFNAIKGCPWPDFWAGESNEDAKAAIDAARAGRVGRFQGDADTVAGNLRSWDVQVTPILGADGKPERLLSVSRDVTTTVAAERALREAQSLNTLILESSRDCIVVLDLAGNTLAVSPGGVAAMEISDVNAILGLSWLRVWAGDDNAAACQAVAEAASGGVGRFQGFCPTHRGAPKWWDVVISPLPGADGRPDRLVSIARDVTDQRRAEAQLRDSEERRRLAVEAAAIGTWDFDVVTRALYWDDRCKELFGLPPDAEVSFDAYAAAIHPDDAARVHEATAAAQDPAALRTYQMEYRTVGVASGTERWVAVAGKTRFEGDQAVRMVGTVVDITARKRAEEQARLLGEELQHRVKNTLAMVQAIVHQTLRNATTPADAQAAIAPRLTAMARAHDMLIHGRWEGADLSSVIEAALRPHDDGRAGRFHIAGPEAWLSAQAGMSMALLLHELGTNAAKYGALSAEGGRVEIVWTVGPSEAGRGAHLRLVWRESGGPPVREPSRRGFGSRLIEQGLASAFAGKATLAFEPDGVTCVVEGALEELNDPGDEVTHSISGAA